MRISPIPKVESPVGENYFRPVSILPAISKIFERLVLRQLITFIEKADLFTHRMSGFNEYNSAAFLQRQEMCMLTAQGWLLEETITLNLQDLKFKKTRFRILAPLFGTAYL